MQLRIVTAELDPTVVELAKRWFDIVEDSKHTIFPQDGLQFIENAVQRGTAMTLATSLLLSLSAFLSSKSSGFGGSGSLLNPFFNFTVS